MISSTHRKDMKLLPFVLSLVILSIVIDQTPAYSQADHTHDIQMPAILSDNAVLQAGHPIPIWGRGKPGTKLTVQLNGQTVETIIDETGKFLVYLPATAPSHTPHSLTIQSDAGTTIQIKNIIIGDVWLASGQSNMEWELENVKGGQQTAIHANDPSLRLFEIDRRQRLRSDGGDIQGKWVVVQPRSARKFSAVGYYFGQMVRSKTAMPVGVIQAAYGGTKIEAWTPRPIIVGDTSYSDQLTLLNKAENQAIRQRQKWIQQSKQWVANKEQQDPETQLSSLLSTNPPQWPLAAFSKHTPSVLFTGMIEPILPFSLKGVIWYQGESNWRSAGTYAYRLDMLVRSWRQAFKRDLPFGIVQIAPYARYTEFPKIWDAQRRVVQATDQTGLIVITDVADLDDIHPRAKQPVGERLALWALKDVYHLSDAYYSGPLFQKATFSPDTLTLEFTFADTLTTRKGQTLSGFEIAGPDGIFKPVEAKIVASPDHKQDHKQDHIIIAVNSDTCQVRYEWRSTADPILTNSSGLPASPFYHSECGGKK